MRVGRVSSNICLSKISSTYRKVTRRVSRSEQAVWKKRTLTTICESCERLLIICRRR